jgi:hypothetical protein
MLSGKISLGADSFESGEITNGIFDPKVFFV